MCISFKLSAEKRGSTTQGWLFTVSQVTQVGKEVAQTSSLAKMGNKTEHVQLHNFQHVYTFLMSSVPSTHVLRSVLGKIVFCLKKLNVTALMLQVTSWVGGSFGFTRDVQRQIEIAVNLQTSESRSACYSRREDVRMYADM